MALLKRIVLEKPLGKTPLEAVSSWKAANPAYMGVPASYAGRLDPMASGKLLVLLGDECKKQKAYTTLDKEYVIEVLLDVGSDTGDVLGIAQGTGRETRVDLKTLRAILSHERGAHEHAYPAFSSKTVAGKPLFLYALTGTLDTIEIPTHEERIYKISILKTGRIAAPELRMRIEHLLSLAPSSDEPSKALGADFRIDTVRASWDTVFAAPNRDYALLTFRVSCASGTYMRSLAGRIGEALGTGALALSIRRTRIGRYLPPGIWYAQY